MTGGRCLAAGVVSPGIILPDRVLLAPNVPSWEQLALRDAVRDGLGIAQVAVGIDVKAAAAAEVSWGSLQGVDPAVFLSLGTGVAAALVIGGQVLTGAAEDPSGVNPTRLWRDRQSYLGHSLVGFTPCWIDVASFPSKRHIFYPGSLQVTARCASRGWKTHKTVSVLPSANQRLFFSFRDEFLDGFELENESPEAHSEETIQVDLHMPQAGA